MLSLLPVFGFRIRQLVGLSCLTHMKGPSHLNLNRIDEPVSPLSSAIVNELPCWPLVVPESLQDYILLLFHNHAASADFSEGKMMQRLLRRFTWKFMSTDVHNYAKGCLFCKQ